MVENEKEEAGGGDGDGDGGASGGGEDADGGGTPKRRRWWRWFSLSLFLFQSFTHSSGYMRSVAIPRARTKYLTLTIGETHARAPLPGLLAGSKTSVPPVICIPLTSHRGVCHCLSLSFFVSLRRAFLSPPFLLSHPFFFFPFILVRSLSLSLLLYFFLFRHPFPVFPLALFRLSLIPHAQRSLLYALL